MTEEMGEKVGDLSISVESEVSNVTMDIGSLSGDENHNFSFSSTDESFSSSNENLPSSSAKSILPRFQSLEVTAVPDYDNFAIMHTTSTSTISNCSTISPNISQSFNRGTNEGIPFANLIPELCLGRIFTYVTSLRERVTCVELACKRWREISRKTAYAGTKLAMRFGKELPRILVYFQDRDVDVDELSNKGQFEVPWPCTDTRILGPPSRRMENKETNTTCRDWNLNGEVEDLPEATTRFFHEFLCRCSKNIRSLSFGGLTSFEESAGYMDPMTAQFPASFLEMITESCPNLDSLFLRDTVLQTGTMHILQLREDFPNIGTRLKSLCLHGSNFKNTSVSDFGTLSPSLRELSLSTNLFRNLEKVENALRTSGKDHPGLKFCQLQLNTADFENNENYAPTVKYVLERSEKAEVSIKLDLLRGPGMRIALSSMLTCTSVTNLTLVLHGSTLRKMQLTHLFAGIGEMSNLESLQISGYRLLFCCSSLRSLVLNGLARLEKLHTLKLLEVTSKVHASGWTDCVGGLRNLKSFHLRMAYEFNDGHLYQLVKNNPGLEYLSLEQCKNPNLSFRSIFAVLKNLKHLHAIRVHNTIRNMPASFYSVLSKQVASSSLSYVSVEKIGEPTPEQEMTLKKRFESVRWAEGKRMTVAVRMGLFIEDFFHRRYCQLCDRAL